MHVLILIDMRTYYYTFIVLLFLAVWFPTHTVHGQSVAPLYLISSADYSSSDVLGTGGRMKSQLGVTSTASLQMATSVKLVHVAFGSSSRVQVYTPFSNETPASMPVRRSNGVMTISEDDADEGPAPTNPSDPDNMPVGSSAVLVLFALAYAAYIVTKKRLSNINH